MALWGGIGEQNKRYRPMQVPSQSHNAILGEFGTSLLLNLGNANVNNFTCKLRELFLFCVYKAFY